MGQVLPRTQVCCTGSREIPVIRFHLAGRPYAIPLECVREPVEPATIRPVPGTPPEVLGLAAWRGGILTVLDAAAMLGDLPRASTNAFLLLAEPHAHVAVRLPSDHRFATVLASETEPCPQDGSWAPGTFGEAAKRLVLLDPAWFLDRLERRIAERCRTPRRLLGPRRAAGGA